MAKAIFAPLGDQAGWMSFARSVVILVSPVPSKRIYWLDRPAVDSVARRALGRAFDESALYDDEVRAASYRRPRPPAARRLAPHPLPPGRAGSLTRHPRA